MDGQEQGNVDRSDLNSPVKSPHHDVFVTAPIEEGQSRARLYQFKVDKKTGEYKKPPIELSPGDPGERKVRGLAQQDSGSGIAFATLPVKDEPASSAVSCYLINRQVLNYTTAWTRAPWNDHPDDVQKRARSFVTAPVNEAPADPAPRFLVALSSGEVLDLQVERNDKKPEDVKVSASLLNLESNPDVWRLLRNGCVAGAAVHEDETPLPLFSLASIHLDPAPRRPQKTDITGTLDFKWRPGATVKVRVEDKELDPEFGLTREQAIQKVSDLAQTWLEGGVDLKLDFLDLRADRPKQEPDDYDILVSLARLGEARGVVSGDEENFVVSFPLSQLGNYAEREERAIPTMFLGLADGLKVPDDKGGTTPVLPKDYFDSDVFKHIVLHEFGHALGLPHLHQHPELKENPFQEKSDDEIANGIKTKLGIKVPQRYIRQDLKGRWPGLKYSQWPEVKANEKNYDGTIDQTVLDRWLRTSVMFGLPGGNVLNAGKDPLIHTALGETDHEWIALLYPPKPAAD